MKNRGFTLLEMLIVMTIISILTSVLWANFFSSLAKGRDSRRKQDLEAISRALELYYNDNKAYPTAIPGPATPFVHPEDSSVIYMSNIPAHILVRHTVIRRRRLLLNLNCMPNWKTQMILKRYRLYPVMV